MKKLMLIAALLAFVTLANAQKSEDACKKAVANAKAQLENPKKASNPATWINYAKANVDAYTSAVGNGWVGGNKTEIDLIMSGTKATETITETVNGNEYTVDVYPSAKYYYNAAGVLEIIASKPYVENALENAVEAYSKAAELDVKGAKTKDIKEALKKIGEYFQNEAVNAYTFGNLNLSSDYFGKAITAKAAKPLCEVDSAATYNQGLTAFFAGNHVVAKASMLRCINIDYLENGEVFAKLAECEKALGDTLACKKALEAGFEKCPQNQNILIGLINLYLDTNDDPEKLFVLLDAAKVNEPTNASLYYVEGNIRKQLGQTEKAIEAYEKCAEVNPEYEYGYIGAGILHWDEAVKIQEEAEQEFNDKKYQALVERFDTTLEEAIPYFEKAFEITKDNSVKLSLGEYLKNIFFRFRDKDESYQAAYDKYNEYVKASSAE